MTEEYSYEEVCEVLKQNLEHHRTVGVYAPLLARMDVYIDDDIPPATRRVMNERNHAPACVTDGLKLSIDRKSLYAHVNACLKEWREDGHTEYANSVREEINNVLVHEFTHALCQHPYQGNKFFDEKTKNGGKLSQREYMAWMMACEVEANRGYGIQRGHSPIYWAGVTDTFTYPKARSAKYLRDIYEVILKEYGDQLEDDYEDVKKEVEKMLKQAQQESQKKGRKDEEKDDGSTNGGDAGEGSDNGSGSTSEDNEGDKCNGQGDKTGSGDNEDDGGGEDSNPNGGNSNSGDSSSDKIRQQRIKAIAEALTDPSNEVNVRQYDPDFDKFDTKQKLYDGSQGKAGGLGGGGIDASGKTPDEVLTEWENIYNKKVIEKALARLKGEMVGTIAKERVATYSRQARRDSSDGLLKKGTKRASRSVPKILVALDKSGSMSSTTTAQATEALAKIFEVTGRPTAGCWICLHDGDVKATRPFKQWKSVVAQFYPSGGNDFSAVVRLANKLNVDVVLNVGDAGDRLGRDRKAAEAFRKSGRRWIDVNITRESRSYNGNWIREMFPEDYVSTGIVREWEDLTGSLEYEPEAVVKDAKRKYPGKCDKWLKK